MNKTLLGASSALALSIATTVCAEDVTELEPIIVSGGFTPVEEANYGRAASVITAEDIANRGLRTVQDALRAVPGVSVSGSGDNFTQVRIRGGEGNNTLILIDGVPAAGGNDEYILSGLETANIERIEVLRGPQSVFYGSSASSGVINIITKRGNIGQEVSGKIELGGTQSASARYSNRTERGGAAVSLSYADDEGYDISGSGGEKDGMRRATVNLTGDYLITDDFKVGLTYRNSSEDYDTDPQNYSATNVSESVTDDPNAWSERDEWLGSLFAEYTMLDGRMAHRFTLEASDYESKSSTGRRSQSDRKTARYLLSFALDGASLGETNHLLNAIAERTEKRSSSNSGYHPDRNSYALEYRGNFGAGLSVQGGLRRDNNSTFEDDTTWNASVAYAFANGIRLKASAGEGSVDPSFFELFATGSTVGNPNLTPEKNESYDIGLEIPVLQGRGLVDVTVFQEKLTDEIEWYYDAGLGSSTYRNRAETADRSGLELAASLQATSDLDLRLSYTYLDASNANGTVEVRRPQHELLLSATQRFLNDRGSVTADLRYVAGNYDTQFFGSFPVVKLPDYATLDVSARYDLNDRLTLTGRVTNLTDKDYSDVWGYAKRGRTFFVGLESSF